MRDPASDDIASCFGGPLGVVSVGEGQAGKSSRATSPGNWRSVAPEFRAESLDRLRILNRWHLEHALRIFVHYYKQPPTHRSLRLAPLDAAVSTLLLHPTKRERSR